MVIILTISIIALLIVYGILSIYGKTKRINENLDSKSRYLRDYISRLVHKDNETEINNCEGRYNKTTIVPEWSIEIIDINGNTFSEVYMFQEAAHKSSKITIGTGECTIKIICQGSFYVGRYHAFLEIRNNELVLVDNNSTNRTFNQKHEAIKEAYITDGTTIYLSDLVGLRFNKISARDFYEVLKSDRKVRII